MARPIVGMAAVSVICGLAVVLATGLSQLPAALLGMMGPLAAAVGSWILIERLHRRSPGRVQGLMVKLFGAKMLLFAAYVTAVIGLMPAGAVPFVVSFTVQYITLHLVEALYLRRLFTADRQVSVS